MRRQLNPAFAGSANSVGGVSASNKMTPIQRACDNARTSGRLLLDNLELKDIPQEFSKLYEPPIDETSSKWWECAQLTALSLSGNELTRIDDGTIGAFTTLHTVNLAHNKLAAVSQDIFSELVALKKLDVSYNELTALPHATALARSLVDVSFAHNALTSLPADVGCLLHLTVLNVSYNALSTLPNTLADCTALRRLDVSFNALTALPALHTLKQLESLEAKHNKLSVAPSLSALTKLVSVDFSENALTVLPSLPTQHGRSQLASVIAHSNQLMNIDALSPPQDATETLSVVDVHQNKLAELPRDIHRFRALKHVDVSNNDLSDLPSTLGLIESLNKLITDGNPLRSVPRSKLSQPINALKTYLRSRILSDDTDTQRGGTQTNDSVNLTQLQYAIRDATASHSLVLSGITPKLQSLPAEVMDIDNASIAALTALDVSQQRMTDLPQQILRFKHTLTKLNIAHNGFAHIPAPIFALNKLTELDLSHNQLSEHSVPPAIAQLSQLHTIELHHNKLDSVPPPIMRLTQLTHLDLSFNAISALDNDITTLALLRTLNLSDNKLERIPNRIFLLSRMQTLNVANNQLSVVPLELSLCPALSTLLLTGNPQRIIKQTVLSRGAVAIKQFLRDRIVAGSDLERTALTMETVNQRSRLAESSDSASPPVTEAAPARAVLRAAMSDSNRRDDETVNSPSPMSVESLRAAIKDVTFELDNSMSLSKSATINLKKKLTLMRLNLNKLESSS